MQKEDHFGEDITADTCCTSLGGALCDNCEKLEIQGDNIQLVSRIQEFSIVAEAISDLPNHGIHKVIFDPYNICRLWDTCVSCYI
jgi:hypothetical protein